MSTYIGCQCLNYLESTLILILHCSKVKDIKYLLHIHGVAVSLKTFISLCLVFKKNPKNTLPFSSVNAVMSACLLFFCIADVWSLCIKRVGTLCAVVMLAPLDDLDWQYPFTTIEASRRLTKWNYKIIDNEKLHSVNIIITQVLFVT